MATLETSIRIAVLDAFSGPLNKLGLELKGAGKAAKSVGDSFDFAAKLSIASEAVGRFADAAKAAVAAPANEFIEFEHQMSKVAAVGDLTGKSFEMLKTQALDLGEATRYSATQAAEAQENLVSAGFDVNKIMKLTPVALNLATAGALDLARSSEILSGTMKAFSKDASEAANVSDILASAAALSAADVEYLAEVFSKAGPVAKTLGIDLETVAASAAVMAEAQIGAAEGGTALKTVMLRLSAPAKAARDAFTSLGFGKDKLAELQAQLGRGDMPGVLKAIGTSFDQLGLSAVQRVEKLKHIFGDEAVAQASVMIDAAMRVDPKGLQQLDRAFRKVDGAATKMAMRMDSDTAGSLERLSSNWSGFMLKIGESMSPALNEMSEALQKDITAMTEWSRVHPNVTSALGRMAILGVGAVIALKGVLIGMSTMVSIGGLIGKAFIWVGPLAAAIGKLWAAGAVAVTGVTAATAGFVLAAGSVGYAIGTVIDHFFNLSDKLASAFEWITGIKSASTQAAESGANKDTQTYADGTQIDGRTGKIVKMGTGDPELAPRVVRDARAAGKNTLDEINAFTSDSKLRNDAASPTRTNFSPLAAPVSPLVGDSAAADATREQTAVLQGALGDLKRATEEQTRLLKRRSTGGSTGAGEGAF